MSFTPEKLTSVGQHATLNPGAICIEDTPHVLPVDLNAFLPPVNYASGMVFVENFSAVAQTLHCETSYYTIQGNPSITIPSCGGLILMPVPHVDSEDAYLIVAKYVQ